MVKDLKAEYKAGARENAWIKLKREYQAELTDTIDLVIIGAFHGRGRRAGKYGAFLLAAYDPENDVFKATTKVGTGFTDEDLENFPKLLEPYKIPHRHPRVVVGDVKPDVWFIPKIVIEVIASEITLSPTSEKPLAYSPQYQTTTVGIRFILGSISPLSLNIIAPTSQKGLYSNALSLTSREYEVIIYGCRSS